MDDLNVAVLQGFGIKAKRIVKEKSYYICNTDKGYKLVRKSFDSRDSVLFQHEIKEQLYARGFRWTDRFALSTEGKPFVIFDDNVYTMTDVLDFKEASFEDNRAFEKVVRQTAAFHNTAVDLQFTDKTYYANTQFAVSKSISELSAIKKKVGTQKRLSDFDVLFLKNYGFYMERLQTAGELLAKTNMEQYARRARENNAICHNLLKEENILRDRDDIYIVNFSHAAVGYSLLDLCGLIQRYIKRLPNPCLPVENIVRLYDRHAKLETEEIRILYPLLIYPHKFIRICGQYYSKKRTWTPSAMANRMEVIVGGKDVFDAYVAPLSRY